MLTVADVMTSPVFCLPEWVSLEEAAWALTSRGLGGAPVQDREGRLVGVLSKTDLVDPTRSDGGEDATVGDAMTPAVLALRPGDPALIAVRLMVQDDIHRVLIVDGDGKPVGIVTPMDILQAIAAGQHFDLSIEAEVHAPG